MKWAVLSVSLMLIGAAALAADEIEPLEADFLEYLANLEGDDDNWTLLTEAEDKPPSTDSERRATHAKGRERGKEAAKPAVEEP